jgi:hypothetical protein
MHPPLPLLLALLALPAAACTPRGDAPSRDPATGAWEAPRELSGGAGSAVRGSRIADFRAGRGDTLHALLVADAGDGSPARLLYAEFDGAAWRAPVRLDDGRESVGPAQLAVDGAGAVHAAWIGGSAPEGPVQSPARSEVRHRSRSGGAWSPVAVLYAAPGGIDAGASGLAMAADSAGRVHVVHPGAGDVFVDRVRTAGGWDSLPAGRAGGEPRLLGGPGGAPALADLKSTLPRGGGVARTDPWVRLLGGGGWAAPAVAAAGPGTASHKPQLARNAEGVLHLVWLEAVGEEMLPGRMLHARSADGRAWSAPEELAAGVPGRVFYAPRLAADGAGTLHLTFARFRTDLTDPRLFHQALTAGVWSPAEEIGAGAGPAGGEIESAVDARGRLHALWSGPEGRVLHAARRAGSERGRR